jgi:hypothetical protein
MMGKGKRLLGMRTLTNLAANIDLQKKAATEAIQTEPTASYKRLQRF